MNSQASLAIDTVVQAVEHVDTLLLVHYGKDENEWPKKVRKFHRKMHNHEAKVVKRMTQLAKQVQK